MELARPQSPRARPKKNAKSENAPGLRRIQFLYRPATYHIFLCVTSSIDAFGFRSSRRRYGRGSVTGGAAGGATSSAVAGSVARGAIRGSIADSVAGGAVAGSIAGGVLTGSIAGSAGSVGCSTPVGYLCERITYFSVARLLLQQAFASSPRDAQLFEPAIQHLGTRTRRGLHRRVS